MPTSARQMLCIGASSQGGLAAHRHNKSRGDASKGENCPSSVIPDVMAASSSY